MCSNSECPEGSGHAGVSIRVWECVNAVNSSGNKVSRACFGVWLGGRVSVGILLWCTR